MAQDSRNTAPLGSDFAGVLDLTPGLGIVSGAACLMQALARGILQSPGSEPDDPTYGLGLRDMVGEDIADSDSDRLARKGERQLLRDERVREATVTASISEDGELTLEAEIDSDEGPFSFQVSPSSLTADLLRLKG